MARRRVSNVRTGAGVGSLATFHQLQGAGLPLPPALVNIHTVGFGREQESMLSSLKESLCRFKIN